MMAERCKGLSLALVTVGQAMADRNTPQEWEQAIQELEKFPSEISGMEDQLVHVLKLSYDSLRDDITKSCFIYFSVFPKEYEIRNSELIEHWIGEGFFDDVDVSEARRRGHKIRTNILFLTSLPSSREICELVLQRHTFLDLASSCNCKAG